MLKYYYGTMASGKSATLLMNAYQKELNGVGTIILKPYEERDKNKIKSRVGLESECITFKNDTDLYEIIKGLNTTLNIEHFYIDECQFLTSVQVEQLWKVSRDCKIIINCFGLI